MLAALVLLFAVGASARPVVILLSFDGVRHDYLDRDELPAFERMAREGARADALVPIFPSTTFPNHVALVTGTHADRHGIVANKFLDAKLGAFDYGNDARFLDAEPLWAAAERQGVPAAVFFWVGSETDWRGVGARYRKAPFDSAIGEQKKVEQILAWLDLPEAERPGLVLCWWHGADHAGHEHGPEAKETRAALRAQDRVLGTLLAGLDQRKAWATTTLVIVSDHGMASYARTLDLRSVLDEAGVRARVIHSLATAQIHLKRPEQAERAVAVLRQLPGLAAWRRDELPAELRYDNPRVGDVVALAEPPLALLSARANGARFGGLARLFGRSLGAHGYDPARFPEMHGIFVALGRGVPAGVRLPRVRAIDVAPTLARLLGIRAPANSEGAAIEALMPPSQSPRPPPPSSAR
jgi:predicted AlkP superfamily pyrophosphatase or phosphodiesterase